MDDDRIARHLGRNCAVVSGLGERNNWVSIFASLDPERSQRGAIVPCGGIAFRHGARGKESLSGLKRKPSAQFAVGIGPETDDEIELPQPRGEVGW
jgi:hypothetical protein